MTRRTLIATLLALTWMWGLFGLAVWRGLLQRGSRFGSGALGAAALSLVIILLHGFVDDVLYGSRGVLLLFIPLAFAVPYLRRTEGAGARWVSWVLPTGLVLVMIVALVLRGPVLSLLSSNLAAVHQSQTELGVYSWPEWPIQDEVRRQVDLGQAMAEFERVAASPVAENAGLADGAQYHLGSLHTAAGNTEGARTCFEECLRLNPQHQRAAAALREFNEEVRVE